MILRLKYEKYGPIRFVGHLDIMRYFQKVLLRAEIPVKFSEGYSPHMLMTFAHPLPAGATSSGDYVDITLVSEESDISALTDRINAVCHEGIRVTDASILAEKAENAMRAVKANAWEITFRDPEFTFPELQTLLTAYWERAEIPVTKQTKHKETTFDLKPLVHEICVLDDPVRLCFMASAGNTDNIKPTLLSEDFLCFSGYPKAQDSMSATARLRLHHVETYMELDGKLTPLIPPA